MALKEKNISKWGLSNPGDGGLTNCSPASSLPGLIKPEEEGDRRHHDDGTLPSPVNHNHVWYGGVADVGGESAVAPNLPPIAGLCSPVPSEPSLIQFSGCGQFIWVASDENEWCTWAVEEESLGEEETLRHLHCTCYWIVDTDECPPEPGGSENEPPELKSWTGKGKEQHWATEEDKESSGESLKVVGIAWYCDNEASCKDSASEAHHHGIGLMEGWSARMEDNSECYVLTGTHCLTWAQGICGFNGSVVQTRSRWPSRDRGWEESMEAMNCQSKTKTKLRSTTDTKAILIVEGPQLIVNKHTQVCHYESYGRNWKQREQWRSTATIITMSHRPGCVGEAVVKVQGKRQKGNKGTMR